jgi:hypothetical protein
LEKKHMEIQKEDAVGVNRRCKHSFSALNWTE